MEESQKGLSAGRVQSVALKLIIDREEEINAFKPEEYWTIDGTFKHNGVTFKAKFLHENNKPKKLKNSNDVKAIVSQLSGNQFDVTDVSKKKSSVILLTRSQLHLCSRKQHVN